MQVNTIKPLCNHYNFVFLNPILHVKFLDLMCNEWRRGGPVILYVVQIW